MANVECPSCGRTTIPRGQVGQLRCSACGYSFSVVKGTARRIGSIEGEHGYYAVEFDSATGEGAVEIGGTWARFAGARTGEDAFEFARATAARLEALGVGPAASRQPDRSHPSHDRRHIGSRMAARSGPSDQPTIVNPRDLPPNHVLLSEPSIHVEVTATMLKFNKGSLPISTLYGLTASYRPQQFAGPILLGILAACLLGVLGVAAFAAPSPGFATKDLSVLGMVAAMCVGATVGAVQTFKTGRPGFVIQAHTSRGEFPIMVVSDKATAERIEAAVLHAQCQGDGGPASVSTPAEAGLEETALPDGRAAPEPLNCSTHPQEKGWAGDRCGICGAPLGRC